MRGGNSLAPPPEVYVVSAQSVLTIIIFSLYAIFWGFPGGSMIKNPPRYRRHGSNPWVRKIPWRKAWLLISGFSPGESHGLRSLVGCSPWGHKESNMTEAIEHSLAHALFWEVHEFIHSANTMKHLWSVRCWNKEVDYACFPVGFPGGAVVKSPPASAGVWGLIPGSGRSPGEREWLPTPVLLPGEFHGQKSLVGYSPWGHK